MVPIGDNSFLTHLSYKGQTAIKDKCYKNIKEEAFGSDLVSFSCLMSSSFSITEISFNFQNQVFPSIDAFNRHLFTKSSASGFVLSPSYKTCFHHPCSLLSPVLYPLAFSITPSCVYVPQLDFKSTEFKVGVSSR